MDIFLEVDVPQELCQHLFLSFVRIPQGNNLANQVGLSIYIYIYIYIYISFKQFTMVEVLFRSINLQWPGIKFDGLCKSLA